MSAESRSSPSRTLHPSRSCGAGGAHARTSGRATFALGNFDRTGLSSGSQRAVMSVDAFWMVLNKSASLCEMARIVGHGGRLAMTTWVPRLDELENMLRTAGFRLISSAQTPRWRERQMAVYRGILRNRVPLEQEIGPGAAAVLVAEARDAPARLSGAPRRLIVAERQA